MSEEANSLDMPGRVLDLDGIVVTNIVTDHIAKRTVLYATTNFEIPNTCPDCHVNLHSHSSKKVCISHAPMSGYPSQIELIKHRKRCPKCGKVFNCGALPFMANKRNITKALVRNLIEFGMRTTFLHAQEHFGISDSTAQRVVADYFGEMDKKHKFELPYSLGLDEVKIGKTFRTTVTNLQKRTLVDFLERRQGDFLKDAFEKRYSEAERAKVRWVCTDMYRPFEKPLRALFPNAEWVIDHFHVVRYGNECIEEIRRSLQSQIPERKLAKGIKKRLRYTLLNRQKDLTEDERQKIDAISVFVPELKIAYGIKEDFFEIYDQGNRQDAEAAFANWESNLPTESVYDPFRNVANMVHNFYEPIFRYWDSNGLTNGYTECANALARAVDRRARGMRFNMLRGMLLYNPKALADGTIGKREYGAKLDYKPDQDDSQTSITNNALKEHVVASGALMEGDQDEN